MTPDEFTLQPEVAKLLDEEVVTHAWPLPKASVWKPQPKSQKLAQKLQQILFHFAARMASAVRGGTGR